MKALIATLVLAISAPAFADFGKLIGAIAEGIEQGQAANSQAAFGGGYHDHRPGPGPGGPGPGYPGYPTNRGRLECNASDKGWEEHWFGHSSCMECLQKHGGCIETCQEVRQIYTCRFQAESRDGRGESFEATSDDRRYAEWESENRCYRAGNRYCRYIGCETRDQKEVVSRRDCGPK